MTKNSKFRNMETGLPWTMELLWETAKHMHGKSHVLYTLRPFDRTMEDGRVIPSLHRFYMQMGDTSEYEFANTYFESWDHWLRIRSNGRIKPIIDKWQAELEFKLRKEAFDRIKEAATNGSLEANKFIVNANLVDGVPEKVLKNGKLTNTNTKGPGRPSNKPTPATMTSEELSDKLELERLLTDLKRLDLN